jgi:hypothetical protein
MSTIPAKALAERKVKRQKQILAVASVILLAIVGFQLTKVLGSGSDPAAPAVLSTSPSLPSSPLAEAPAKLPDTDRVVIQHDSDQLLSFGLFRSKDPFVQQLSSSSSPPLSSPARTTPVPTIVAPRVAPRSTIGPGLTPTTTTTTTTAPTSTVPSPSTTPATPASPVTTSPSTTPSAPATSPTSVLVSTNGVCQTVALNGTFPANEDIFRVVSIAPDGKSIKIGVVGGAYDSGQATATLKLGDKLTLVNTADGTRYVIALQAKCDVQTAPTSKPPTTATTTPSAPAPAPAPAPTPAPATTTTTTTTPIVTDSLDTTTNPFG